jgi:hypothetical protein
MCQHAAYEGNAEAIEKLVKEFGARLDGLTKDGRTALHIAEERGHWSAKQQLEALSDPYATQARSVPQSKVAELAGVAPASAGKVKDDDDSSQCSGSHSQASTKAFSETAGASRSTPDKLTVRPEILQSARGYSEAPQSTADYSAPQAVPRGATHYSSPNPRPTAAAERPLAPSFASIRSSITVQ